MVNLNTKSNIVTLPSPVDLSQKPKLIENGELNHLINIPIPILQSSQISISSNQVKWFHNSNPFSFFLFLFSSKKLFSRQPNRKKKRTFLMQKWRVVTGKRGCLGREESLKRRRWGRRRCWRRRRRGGQQSAECERRGSTWAWGWRRC